MSDDLPNHFSWIGVEVLRDAARIHRRLERFGAALGSLDRGRQVGFAVAGSHRIEKSTDPPDDPEDSEY